MADLNKPAHVQTCISFTRT